jgi:hypothetical protein
VPEADHLLGVLVLQVEVLGHIRSVGAALLLGSQDAEARAARLREAPVYEATLGLLGYEPDLICMAPVDESPRAIPSEFRGIPSR